VHQTGKDEKELTGAAFFSDEHTEAYQSWSCVAAKPEKNAQYG